MRKPMSTTRVAAAALLAAMAVPVALPPSLTAAEPPVTFGKSDQIKDLLAEGVKQYRVGRYLAAANAFAAAIKLDPTDRQAYDWYLACGEPLLLAMQDKGELADVIKDLRRRANIYREELRHDPRYIEHMIGRLSKSEDERVVAQFELIAIGPAAVPYLVAKLSDNRQDHLRVVSRIVLTKMGYRAVLPLTEALNAKDQRLVASVAAVLADIRDPRPLYRLKQISEAKDADATTKQVVDNVIAEIAKATGLTEVPPAKNLFFQEALRYWRGDAQVREEVNYNEALLWRWDESAEGAKKLTSVRAPRYAWSSLIAEEICFDGLAAFPDFPAFQPLLAAVIATQDVDANRRAALAKQSTAPPTTPEEFADAIAERVQYLAEANQRVAMFGAASLYGAYHQCVVNEKYEVAAYLAGILKDPTLAKAELHLPGASLTPDKAGSPLAAGLDHADKLVRYSAAITLATLDPAVPFFNADKVVPALADAIGESGTRVVLVIDPDFRQRNAARDALQQKGFQAQTVADGHAALQRLHQTPMIDAIIIPADLPATLKDRFGSVINVPENRPLDLVQFLKNDWRTSKVPVFVSLPEHPETAARLKGVFDGKATGFVAKPFNADDMQGKLDAALKEAQIFQSNRDEAEAVALAAAIALQQPDPLRSQYDLGKAVDALLKTLESRPDALRIEACKALAVIARSTKAGPAMVGNVGQICTIYASQDATLKPAVRAALILAIGAINPEDPAAVQILTAAIQHADNDVRKAAHAAIAHATAISTENLVKYQIQRRLDARTQGAGKSELEKALAAPTAAAPAAPAADPAATK